jgi:hypothetical protein
MLRQAIAAVRTVRELATPLFAAETLDLVQQLEAKAQLEPPPVSPQPHLPIVVTHVLRLQTLADPYELTGHIDSHNAEVQSFVLLEPIGEAEAALDACVPPGSEARRRLDEVALIAPELGQLALRIADHLDGLARMTMMGPIPMLGIILHAVLSRLVRSGKTEPWDQVAAFEQGLRTTFFHHLLCVRVETPSGGTWTAGGSVRLGDVLAGQKRCMISRPEEPYSMIGHAGLDWRIAEDLFRRQPR